MAIKHDSDTETPFAGESLPVECGSKRLLQLAADLSGSDSPANGSFSVSLSCLIAIAIPSLYRTDPVTPPGSYTAMVLPL